MTTVKKGQKVVETKDAKGLIKNAKDESGYQQGIERFQLALKNGQFGEDKRLRRANRELLAILKRKNELAKNKVKSAANYKELARIFKEELSHLTPDIWERDAADQAAKFIGKTKGKTTPEQEKIVIDYYKAKASSNIDSIEAIRALLTVEGELTGKDANKRASEMMISFVQDTKNPNVKAPTEAQREMATA